MRSRLSLLHAMRVLSLLSSPDHPLKAPQIAAQLGLSVPSLKRLFNNLQAIDVCVRHGRSLKLDHYYIESWGILDKDFCVAFFEGVSESETKRDEATAATLENFPRIHARRLVALLACIEENEAATHEHLARAIDASIATVKRDFNDARQAGIIVERRGSMKSGHYCVKSWGPFDRDALLQLARHQSLA